MKLKSLTFAILLATTSSITATVRAQEPATLDGSKPTTLAPNAPNSIANACIQNQAETLPVPFKDLSPDNWAFKAVMTMYYCGAFRQASPPTLFQQAIPTQSQQLQPKSQSQVSFPENSASAVY